MGALRIIFAGALIAGSWGCPPKDDEPMTAGEAREALEEATLASQVSALTAGEVEFATDFTLGEGAQKAAEALRDFYASQRPCAEVSLVEGPEVVVDYGVEAGCEWRGRTYTGQHRVGVAKAEEAGVQVSHTWVDFSNGRITLNGTSEVTWSVSDLTRRVVHDLSWSDGVREAQGTGDRTQGILRDEAGQPVGMTIEGERTWTSERGTWVLSISGVEARPQDPLPQAGTYSLQSPAGRSLAISFARVDESRIRVTLSAGKRQFSFVVLATGQITEDEA